MTAILLLIDFLIFCPITLKIRYEKDLTLRVGYLFPLIKIMPRKPKKEKQLSEKQLARLEAKKAKKEAKKEAKKAKQEEHAGEHKKSNPFAKKMETEGLGGLIDLLKLLAHIALEAVRKITDHFVISKMDLRLYIGSEDAAKTATTYGYACAGVFPSIAIIEQQVKKCNHTEMIVPCFTETETKIQFVLKARIVPFFILSAGVKALIRTLKALK